MKTQWMMKTGMIIVAMMMVAGVNAQVLGGRGMGPCGQGYGPGGQGYGPGGQGYGPGGQGYGPGGQGYGQGYGRMTPFAYLNLSEEQQEQMKTLRLEQYKAMKPLRAEMVELKAKERTLMSADETDMKALYAVIDDQTELSNKMRKLQAEHKLAGKDILTDEQQMMLEQNRRFSKGRRGPGKGFGGLRGAGRPGTPRS